ncbi:AI-2E family transporter [Tautonia sp. JC769]|uniref:AI-2E family transporter n=1 Tax=Tautonia sp. JC769 TaxID=3232135 RepID=UPI003459EBD3
MRQASDSGSPRFAERPTRSRQVVSLVMLIGVSLTVAVLFYQVIRPLFLPLFLGAVFALLAMPIQRDLMRRGRLPDWLASLIITVVVVLVVVIPTTAGFFLIKDQAQRAIDQVEQAALDPAARERLLELAGDRLPIDTDTLEEQVVRFLRDGEALLFQRAMKALGSATAFVIGSLLFLISGFFFLKDGESILRAWEDLTPLDPEQDRQIRWRFAEVCRGVVLAILLAAMVQSIGLGIIIAILDLIFGIGIGPWIFLLMLLTAIAAMIPFVGPPVVWIPLAGYLFYDGKYAAAIILSVLGAVVIGNLDYLVRMMVLKGTTEMHPLMALISILGGVQLLGVVGIFVGPIVAAVFVSLLRILRQQLVAFERARPAV